MRKAEVYCNKILAGEIIEQDAGNYIFRYTHEYFINPLMPAVSLTLPKSQVEYESNILFPFFSNLVSEGFNRLTQDKILKIDENDDFGLLLATANFDTIGKVTIKPL
jgi:serine/threonine-protein kinase HipA